MKTIQLGRSGLDVPTVAIGCMRINRLEQKDAATFIRTALEAGANFSIMPISMVPGRVKASLPQPSI